MDSAEQTIGTCQSYRRARKKFTRTVNASKRLVG